MASFQDGLLVIQRRFSPRGRYDTLGDRKLAGDHGTIEVVEGGWVLRRTYHRADGRLIGELYNVQTPAEFSPGLVRYTDLEVDVARYGDGRVAVVDEEDLEVVVRAGAISRELADTALRIAYRLADTLRAGGYWRTASLSSTHPPSPLPVSQGGGVSDAFSRRRRRRRGLTL
ncbi:MAG: YgaC family protein [Chloroflexi bacterium]|nr:YgaC family protein [Chloroflexota bacterium]